MLSRLMALGLNIPRAVCSQRGCLPAICCDNRASGRNPIGAKPETFPGYAPGRNMGCFALFYGRVTTLD